MLLKRKRNKKSDNGIKFRDGNNISFKKPSEIKFRPGGYYDYIKNKSNPVSNYNNYSKEEENYDDYNENEEQEN